MTRQPRLIRRLPRTITVVLSAGRTKDAGGRKGKDETLVDGGRERKKQNRGRGRGRKRR